MTFMYPMAIAPIKLAPKHARKLRNSSPTEKTHLQAELAGNVSQNWWMYPARALRAVLAVLERSASASFCSICEKTLMRPVLQECKPGRAINR